MELDLIVKDTCINRQEYPQGSEHSALTYLGFVHIITFSSLRMRINISVTEPRLIARLLLHPDFGEKRNSQNILLSSISSKTLFENAVAMLDTVSSRRKS